MEDPYTFWTQHPSQMAKEIAERHLRTALRYHRNAIYKKLHHFLRIGYAPDFCLPAVEAKIRKDLDGIEWMFITTGESVEYEAQMLPTFGMAPILPKTLKVGYHATRVGIIPRILEEGLLPSNAERQTTNRPDTEGVIHVCAKLTHEGNDNDSAEWWMKALAKENRSNDRNYGIVRIDMARLPAARVYQDMQSYSGVIVDRIDRIPANLITEVPLAGEKASGTIYSLTSEKGF